MLLRAEELEAILARDNSHAADHIKVFAEVGACSVERLFGGCFAVVDVAR
jgi:hypothetical protein